MSITIAETAENQSQKFDLIETKYIGTANTDLVGTKGEAFFDANLDQWFYKTDETSGWKGFNSVEPREIECAADKGWLKGKYIGDRGIGREGKAFWNSELDKWQYRPLNVTKEYFILEGNFIPRRDEDVFDK